MADRKSRNHSKSFVKTEENTTEHRSNEEDSGKQYESITNAIRKVERELDIGRSSSNPFLNFLRDFRNERKSDDIIAVCHFGGKQYRAMTPEERNPYIQEAEEARCRGLRNSRTKIKKQKKMIIDTCPHCGQPFKRETSSRSRSRSTSPESHHNSDETRSIKSNASSKSEIDVDSATESSTQV